MAIKEKISTSPRGTITTFYSYKGGTGRSMALANVACLLARETSLNILLIDWDLEAPGLHHYFADYLPKNHANREGLIEFFQKAHKELPPMPLDEEKEEVLERFFGKLDDYLLPLHLPDSKNKNVFLFKAGRFDDSYSGKVAGFNWQDFFQNIPAFFRLFARYLGRNYHYVFINSRTGHTDIGGICTMLLPEKLVLVFTPNRQSLNGVVDLAHKAVDYRRHSDDTRPLVIYPLPTRLDLGEEKLRRQWQEDYSGQFEDVFREIYDLPEEISLTDYFEKVQIRHTPRFAYGEEIAVLHESARDINAVAFSYQTLKNQLFGTESIWKMNGQAGKSADSGNQPALHIFVSYSYSDEQYFQELKKHLSALTHSMNIEMWAVNEVPGFRDVNKDIVGKIQKSDVFILLVSADFLASDIIWKVDFPNIIKKYESEGALIFPVILRHCDWENSPVGQFQVFPPRGQPISSFENKDEGFVQVVRNLRNLISHQMPTSSSKETTKKSGNNL